MVVEKNWLLCLKRFYIAPRTVCIIKPCTDMRQNVNEARLKCVRLIDVAHCLDLFGERAQAIRMLSRIWDCPN